MLQFLLVLLLPLAVTQNSNPAPARHELRELKLDDRALFELLHGKTFELPQLRVYDQQGRQVADFGGGFAPDTFRAQLEEVLRSPSPKTGAESLEDEAKEIVEKDGTPLVKSASPDFTIVEYWADWCKPCHMQAKLLNEVVAGQPDLAITIFHVEADPQKIDGVVMKKKKK
jgi:hypothetical protein